MASGGFKALALALLLSGPALAQDFSPVIVVNDRAVTGYELDQRIRLLDAFGTPGDLPELARTQLVEERLKQQELERVGVSLSEEGLRRALEDFSGRANLSTEEFVARLGAQGAGYEALRDYVAAAVTWRDYIRTRFGSQVEVTDEDIEQALARDAVGAGGLEVLLTEIIIPTPPGREGEVEALARQLSQIRSTAEFEAAARQYSATRSREEGGRLDWAPISNYPQALQEILLGLAPARSRRRCRSTAPWRSFSSATSARPGLGRAGRADRLRAGTHPRRAVARGAGAGQPHRRRGRDLHRPLRPGASRRQHRAAGGGARRPPAGGGAGPRRARPERDHLGPHRERRTGPGPHDALLAPPRSARGRVRPRSRGRRDPQPAARSVFGRPCRGSPGLGDHRGRVRGALPPSARSGPSPPGIFGAKERQGGQLGDEPVIVVSCGEPAGIGPEVAAKAWDALRRPLLWIGDPRHLPRGTPMAEVSGPEEAARAVRRALPVLPRDFGPPVRPGRPDPAHAPHVVAAIAEGVALLRGGRASALCTCSDLQGRAQGGGRLPFPGHTEYLAHLGGEAEVVMMLACEGLRVVPATIHVALAEVPRLLTQGLLERVLRITDAACATTGALRSRASPSPASTPMPGRTGSWGRRSGR
jgi:parvulin-like peptidyl-prolyl isomerase